MVQNAIRTAIALLLLTRISQAQLVNDCCIQAASYKARYERAVFLLDSTRSLGNRLLKSKDSRIAELEKEGTKRLVQRREVINQQAAKLETNDELLAVVVDELKDEALKRRFLGIGRRRWAKRLAKQIQSIIKK